MLGGDPAACGGPKLLCARDVRAQSQPARRPSAAVEGSHSCEVLPARPVGTKHEPCQPSPYSRAQENGGLLKQDWDLGCDGPGRGPGRHTKGLAWGKCSQDRVDSLAPREYEKHTQ